MDQTASGLQRGKTVRTTSRHHLLIVVMCLLVIPVGLFGCSSSDGQYDDFGLSWEQVQAFLDEAGESQQPFLEDGVVTESERERAFFNYVECSAMRGVEVYDYKLYPYGSSEFNYRLFGNPGPSTTDESELIDLGDGHFQSPKRIEDTVTSECMNEHFDAVNLLYSYQVRRTGKELEQFYVDIAQCMRDLGWEVSPGATRDQMHEIDMPSFGQCWNDNGGR